MGGTPSTITGRHEGPIQSQFRYYLFGLAPRRGSYHVPAAGMALTDESMNKADFDKLVEGWIAGVVCGRDERGQPTKEHEKNWWALEIVMNWKHDNQHELLWSFILAVHARDTNGESSGHLAAGPVEDLLSEFGSDYIERVEALAASDVRFKTMLCGVWQDGMSDELWRRIQLASSGAC
jgi:hypothetical protein